MLLQVKHIALNLYSSVTEPQHRLQRFTLSFAISASPFTKVYMQICNSYSISCNYLQHLLQYLHTILQRFTTVVAAVAVWFVKVYNYCCGSCTGICKGLQTLLQYLQVPLQMFANPVAVAATTSVKPINIKYKTLKINLLCR